MKKKKSLAKKKVSVKKKKYVRSIRKKSKKRNRSLDGVNKAKIIGGLALAGAVTYPLLKNTEPSFEFVNFPYEIKPIELNNNQRLQISIMEGAIDHYVETDEKFDLYNQDIEDIVQNIQKHKDEEIDEEIDEEVDDDYLKFNVSSLSSFNEKTDLPKNINFVTDNTNPELKNKIQENLKLNKNDFVILKEKERGFFDFFSTPEPKIKLDHPVIVLKHDLFPSFTSPSSRLSPFNSNQFFKYVTRLYDSKIPNWSEQKSNDEILKHTDIFLSKAIELHKKFPNNIMKYEPYIIIKNEPDENSGVYFVSQKINGITMHDFLSKIRDALNTKENTESERKRNLIIFKAAEQYRKLIDLCRKLLEEADYFNNDLHSGNSIIKDNGDIAIIDLEKKDFFGKGITNNKTKDTFKSYITARGNNGAYDTIYTDLVSKNIYLSLPPEKRMLFLTDYDYYELVGKDIFYPIKNALKNNYSDKHFQKLKVDLPDYINNFEAMKDKKLNILYVYPEDIELFQKNFYKIDFDNFSNIYVLFASDYDKKNIVHNYDKKVKNKNNDENKIKFFDYFINEEL